MYVVVFHPDATLNVEVVGPFRSYERAEAIALQLTQEIDSHDVNEHRPARFPHVVSTISAQEAIVEYRIEEV